MFRKIFSNISFKYTYDFKGSFCGKIILKNKYYCNFHFGKEINILKESDLLMSVVEKSEQL